MFKEYYDAGCWVPDVQSAVRETAPWWGTYTKVWVRKNGSKLLKAESPDESPGASLKEEEQEEKEKEKKEEGEEVRWKKSHDV